jgi:hypothetical protein
VYGTWVANGKEAYDETKYNAKGHLEWTPSVAEGKVQFTHTVSTLSFVPDNVSDIPLVEMGMRCKMGVSADIASEASLVGDVDILGTTTFTNLESTSLGLDRFFQQKSLANLGVTNTNLVNGKNIMYAGAPCNVAWAHSKGILADNLTDGDKTREAVSGLGIPFVDGQRRPILSKETGFKQAGWVDIIPSDESFYIGCSFETHPEEVSLVSGSDLTNSTPLHVRLRYSSANGDFYEKRENSDPFTSFVHIDAVLRLTPSGELISSV